MGVFNENNKNSFLMKLQNIDWNSVISCTDTQIAFSEFHNIYKNVFESSFPVIKVKFQYNNRKPWLSNGLRSSIKEKNKRYVKSLKYPTLSNERAYKDYKKILTKILIKEEKKHIQNLLEINKSNLAKSWKIIKGILNKNQGKRVQNTFCANGKSITDKKEIAENFNNLFVNIGPTLSEKNPFY